MEKIIDYRENQKVVSLIKIEDRHQDFTELDILENGVILGNSVIFSHGRLSLLGVGTDDGTDYYDFKTFLKLSKTTSKKMKGLMIYMKNTGEKDIAAWKSMRLNYPIVSVGKPTKPNRFIKKQSN